MSEIKAVVFDLDGVLVDATEWHYEALNKALELFGYEIKREEHLTDYDGLPTLTKLRKLSADKGLPEVLHPLISSLKQQYTREVIALSCRPRFEKEYMVARLVERGYRMAVASNSVRDSIDLMLRRSGILDSFEFFLSNEDVTNPKPDPQIYKLACSRMGLSPDEVVVVEDNHFGIQAAVASGCHVIRVGGVDDVNLELIDRFFANPKEFA